MHRNTLRTFLTKLPPELTYILILFCGSRLALMLIGITSRIYLSPLGTKTPVFSNYLWLDIWGVWDTGWYLNIAEHGYSAEPVDAEGRANYAFFPLYPLLMRFIGAITGDTYIAGIIISNICFIIACILLYRLVRSDADDHTALSSVKYAFLFPTAFIFSGVFTESLYLALVLLSFLLAKKKRWLAAGIAGFFVAITKPVGVLILFPLLYLYLRERNYDMRKIGINILPLLLIPLGIALFALFNRSLTGNPLAFVSVLSAWQRGIANPVDTLMNGIISHNIETLFLVDFTLVCLILLIISYRKVDLAYWIFGFLTILVPLSTGILNSMPRYILVVFPLFILFAHWSKNRSIDHALTIGLALFQGFLMVMWSNGFHLIV